MGRLIFETHATSCDNEMGIASGHKDSPLSAKGISQAKELGTRYKAVELEAIFCSDLLRSHETAKLAFHETSVSIIPDLRLREWNYGKHNGSSASSVEKLKPHYIHEPFPEGESLKDAVERILDFIDESINPNSKKSYLVIGHRAVYYALEHTYHKISLEELVSVPWNWRPGWHYFHEGQIRMKLLK